MDEQTTKAVVKSKGSGGRNPSPDPKQHIQLYVQLSEINSLGGKEKARDFCLTAIKQEVEKRRRRALKRASLKSSREPLK